MLAWVVALWARGAIRGTAPGAEIRPQPVGVAGSSGRRGFPLPTQRAPGLIASSALARAGRESLSDSGRELARVEQFQVGVERVVGGCGWRVGCGFGRGACGVVDVFGEQGVSVGARGELATDGGELNAGGLELGDRSEKARTDNANVQVGFTLLDQGERALCGEAPAAERFGKQRAGLERRLDGRVVGDRCTELLVQKFDPYVGGVQCVDVGAQRFELGACGVELVGLIAELVQLVQCALQLELQILETSHYDGGLSFDRVGFVHADRLRLENGGLQCFVRGSLGAERINQRGDALTLPADIRSAHVNAADREAFEAVGVAAPLLEQGGRWIARVTGLPWLPLWVAKYETAVKLGAECFSELAQSIDFVESSRETEQPTIVGAGGTIARAARSSTLPAGPIESGVGVSAPAVAWYGWGVELGEHARIPSELAAGLELSEARQSIGLNCDVLAWIGERAAPLALGTEVGGWIDHTSLSATASAAASMLDVQAAGRGRSGRRARGFSLTCGAGTGVQG